MQNVLEDISINGKEVSLRQRSWWVIFIAFGALLSIVVLFLSAWFPSKAVETAYEIDNLKKQKESLEEENNQLAIERARLKAPERINKLAIESLKMVRPSETEVIVLER